MGIREQMRLLRVSLLMGVVVTSMIPGVTSKAGIAPDVLYVSATDPTCGGRSPCFTTIQAAVNAARAGDEIRVAAGTYTGAAPAMVGGDIYTQVVLITKSLTLQGGYTTTNWTEPDPAMNRTVIDAERRGRGISIVGDGTQTVTVAGFTITNGDYSDLGNPPGIANRVCARTGSDCGGGLFAFRVRLNLRDCTITNNIASRTRNYSDGGGAYLWNVVSGSRVENTIFSGNQAQASGGAGGGMSITFGGSVTIVNSRFENNRAAGAGGGLYISQPNDSVRIENSTFTSNVTCEAGGALEARLTFQGTALSLNRVILRENRARSYGAALSFIKQGFGATTVEMTNVVLAANAVESSGDLRSVVEVSSFGADFDLRLAHLTWARHPQLVALRVDASLGGRIAVTLTNALIDSATAAYVGRQVNGEIQIRHTHTLIHRVGRLHVVETGVPTFEAINPREGDPRLDETAHLQQGSAAIDAGAESGVREDIDGEARPAGRGYDIGADEFIPPSASSHLAQLRAQSPSGSVRCSL
ncbi:MAG: right-handed parallel beta-helix repeat-containing protein [Blastocatellia bacterium]|nr:right-handed parallel beta-helix repeat-containing protein [Blastocatellia bacterium]MDW8255861.1 right-handed parallel beta-helix repeat-containing protein [Acidobacteriota bacterium]